MAFQFYVSIKEIKPIIWRRLVVPKAFNFYQLHLVIQGAFGWTNSHLFQFSKTGLTDKESIGMPYPYAEHIVHEAKDILISSLFKTPKAKQIYMYDFGDHWEHIVRLEAIEPNDPYLPVCIHGENECPPEDVGGVSGYERKLECFASGTAKEKRTGSGSV